MAEVWSWAPHWYRAILRSHHVDQGLALKQKPAAHSQLLPRLSGGTWTSVSNFTFYVSLLTNMPSDRHAHGDSE